MSSNALLKGSVILSAYGENYYAFVFAPSLFVIYGLTDKKVVYKQSFANAVTSAVRPFTSLVTSGNNFHVGLIDGRIFSFVVASSFANSVPAKYKFIDSNDDRLPGYKRFRRDPSKQRIELLGCDKQVIVYSTNVHRCVAQILVYHNSPISLRE
jgi:hypothetical protein